MKRFFFLALLFFLALSPAVRADGPDDQYVVIYGLIQSGDLLAEQNQFAPALAKYQEAQAALKKFSGDNPGWNEKVVHYRLNYLAAKITAVSSAATNAPAPAVAVAVAPVAVPSIPVAPPAALVSAPASAPAPEQNHPAPAPSAPAATPAPLADAENQIKDLQAQVNRAQAERDALAAQLKDALAAAAVTNHPAASAPPSADVENQLKDLQAQVSRVSAEKDTLAAQLKDALAAVAAATNNPSAASATPAAPPPLSPAVQNQIKDLQDQLNRSAVDKDLLAAKLKEALAARPAAVDPRELAKAEDTIKELQKENELLKVDLAQAKTNTAPADTTAADQARQALAEANQKISRLGEANAALAVEKDALQARVKTLAAPDQAGAALQAENAVLKNQLAELQSKAPAVPQANDLDRQLREAQSQIAALQSDKDILNLQKAALESRIQRITAMPVAPPVNAPVAPASPPADLTADAKSEAKIRHLEQQRDELLTSLTAVITDLQGHKKGKETVERMDEMSRQLATQSARIDTLEAQSVPYSPDELALFKAPVTTLLASAHHSGKKSFKELPPGAGPLLNEAQQFFAERQFDQAEEKYLEVLKLDDKNIVILANLAAIQLEMNHLDEAEKHLLQALVIEPDDAYSLAVLGRLKFQEQKYDDALDALSRAAQLDPQNAEIENYLGITLSHKGLRGPAETALRKAIQLDPNYGSAHNNLAVVYVTQKPPLLELARWHYQKAMAAGHPRNPDLEKLLDLPGSAPVAQ